MTPDNVKEVEVFAWVGEDEFGSGEVGLKQAYTPCGLIPLVASKDGKLDQGYIVEQMQLQSTAHNKTIRLCKFKFVEEVITVNPNGQEIPNS